MGQGLPKAVTPLVVKRGGDKAFRIGFAEMNGWRPAMEDAHVIHPRETWGFFGVFDGHGGRQCSKFIAGRLSEELRAMGRPADDATVRSLMLRLDREFLETKQPSGSTGTFVFVDLPPEDEKEKKYTLRVGNIGDSRVLLSRKDGTLVPGNGTDGALTTDHKPDHPDEVARIERTGGKVELVMGVARVNGDLAVSRAFGDAQHKETGGPAQEDHPVSAEPELGTVTCDPTDFIVLVCDGISEQNFANEEVVRLAAQEMAVSEGPVDPALAAAAVCRKALERGSTDNLSCMIVLLSGGEMPGAELELLPGPFSAPTHSGFRKAYADMAEHAGLTLEAAVELRYDAARAERVAALVRRPGDEAEASQPSQELREELAAFGEGPPEDCKGLERTAWFREWLAKLDVEPPALDPSTMNMDQMVEAMERNERLLEIARMQGFVSQDFLRHVQVKPLEELRPAVEAHPALKWDDRLTTVCGCRGRVVRDDDLDGTSQVKLGGVQVWLPTSSLISEEDQRRLVRVSDEEALRTAVEAHPALKWQDRLATLSGCEGRVLVDDASDATSQVRFVAPRMTVWLPTEILLEISEPDEREAGDAESGDADAADGEPSAKKPRNA